MKGCERARGRIDARIASLTLFATFFIVEKMSEDNQPQDEGANGVEVQEEPRTYEITATDHINKSMLGK